MSETNKPSAEQLAKFKQRANDMSLSEEARAKFRAIVEKFEDAVEDKPAKTARGKKYKTLPKPKRVTMVTATKESFKNMKDKLKKLGYNPEEVDNLSDNEAHAILLDLLEDEPKPKKAPAKKATGKKSVDDIEKAKAEIKRKTGKTEEECESIIEQYRALRAKAQEGKRKAEEASKGNKQRIKKLQDKGDLIEGTNEKTADAVIETSTKDVADKIEKEIEAVEEKAEKDAKAEVAKDKTLKTPQAKKDAIKAKVEEQVKQKTKPMIQRIVIDTSELLTTIATSLGKFDKDSQKEFLIKLRSDIDKLLSKYAFGGMTDGATQVMNIQQSNLSASSVNPTLFGKGGGVDSETTLYKVVAYNEGRDFSNGKNGIVLADGYVTKSQAEDTMYGWKGEVYPYMEIIEYKGKDSYKKGGGVGSVSYDAVLNLLKEKLEDSVDDLPRHFEMSSEFKGEEVEHQSRDGFIAYTDGGYEVRWFEYLSMFWGAGYGLPTSGLDNEKERQIDYSLETARDYFKDEYPEIVEELGEDNIDYNSLYEAGYEDEAEELSNAEQDNMDGTIMCEIGAYYYAPNNDRGIDGKHTLRLFGLVNLESPYHRSGNLEDRYDIDITFDSIEDLEQKIDEGLEAIIRWFDGDFYNDSTEELRIRRMAQGGMTEHGLREGDKIIGSLASNKDEIYIVDGKRKAHVVNLDKGKRYGKGGGVEDELYLEEYDGSWTIRDKKNPKGRYTLMSKKERAEENRQFLINNPSKLAYYRKNEYAKGGGVGSMLRNRRGQ